MSYKNQKEFKEEEMKKLQEKFTKFKCSTCKKDCIEIIHPNDKFPNLCANCYATYMKNQKE